MRPLPVQALSQEGTGETTPRDLAPSHREWVSVLVLLIGFLAFNLATYNEYPAVWCDEVSFSEPAINWVLHGSFTTTVWQFQRPNTFPTVNCPLYSLALAPWLAANGTSLVAVRSFNYTFMAAAAFLLWMATWRFGVVKSAPLRITMLVLLHLGYGMSYAYRCSRPDIISLVCLLLLLLAFLIRQPRVRATGLLLFAALTIWAGLQVALFAWFACFAAWLVLKRVRLCELIVISFGMALGVETLAWFLWSKGVLGYFLPPVIGLMGKHYAHSAHQSVGAAVARVIGKTWSSYVADFSTIPIALTLFVLLVAGGRNLNRSTHGLIRYCLVLVLGVPALFNLAGHYAFYYSYMLFVPAAIGFFAGWSDLTTGPRDHGTTGPRSAPWVRPLLLAATAAAMVVGMPMRLALTLAACKITPRAEIQRVVRAHVTPDDVAYSDFAGFFEVKQVARVVYDYWSSSALAATHVPGRDFTMKEKSAISVLVIRPEEAARYTNFFGGQWQAVTGPFGDSQDFSRLARLPLIGKRIAHHAGQPQTERYPVQIFRRPST